MTDKNVLRDKLKDRLPPLSTQGCKKAPGHLAIFVKRADNQDPLAGVKVKAQGPTSGDGETDQEGWIVFSYRNPGQYKADITLPDNLRAFRLPKPQQKGSVPGCGTEILEFDATPPKVGVALGFRAILFKKDANPVPDAVTKFELLTDSEFGNHLLADGESKGVIQVELVKLNEKGKADAKAAPAGPEDHFDEGEVVLELSSADFGELSYAGKSGSKISVPVKDIRDGKSPLDKDKGIIFTTSRKIGEAKLTAKIENAKTYEYVHDFKRERGSKELTVGSRPVALNTKGYDARKVQWFLRRAGFLSFKESILWKHEKRQNDASCEWSEIKDIGLDGDFGARSAQCLRDFQRVARGSFRNQATKKVTPTLTAAMSEQVSAEVISEFIEWRAKSYKVQPHNGYAHLKGIAGTTLDQEARIVYGALVVRDGHDAKGYVEIKDPVGGTVCHWEDRAIVVADEIRCAIKLFEKEVLKFRLHDADPWTLPAPGEDVNPKRPPVLEDTNLHATFTERIKATIRKLRSEQKASLSGANARDVRLTSGYRSVGEQEKLYKKGRYTWTDKNGKTHMTPKPPKDGEKAEGTEVVATNGERCTHDKKETIAIGDCLVHPQGVSVPQPCKHGEKTLAIGTCKEHPQGIPEAKPCEHPAGEKREAGTCKQHPLGSTVTGAEPMESWHQFAVAVDLVFYDANGDPSWDDGFNWTHNGEVAEANKLHWGGRWKPAPGDRPHIQLPDWNPPGNAIVEKYEGTAGTDAQKLQAVWTLIPNA